MEEMLSMAQLAKRYDVPLGTLKKPVANGDFPEPHFKSNNGYHVRKFWRITPAVDTAMREIQAKRRTNKERSK